MTGKIKLAPGGSELLRHSKLFKKTQKGAKQCLIISLIARIPSAIKRLLPPIKR